MTVGAGGAVFGNHAGLCCCPAGTELSGVPLLCSLWRQPSAPAQSDAGVLNAMHSTCITCRALKCLMNIAAPALHATKETLGKLVAAGEAGHDVREGAGSAC